MLAVAVIVFFEVLEAALIVSIVMAASVGIAGRNRWIGGGIAAGIAVAGPIALIAASIASAFISVVARLVAPPPLSPGRRRSRALGFAGVGALVSASLAPGAARADIHVRSPLVTLGEFEFEMNGLAATKSKGTAGLFNSGQSYTYALGYAPLPWYRFEIETETGAEIAETGSGASERLKLQAQTLENFIQLTPDGKYFVNAGLFFEYSQGLQKGSPNSLSFGPLLSKEVSDLFGVDTLHTFNVFLEREVGPNSSHDTGLFYAWQSLALLHPLFSPGIELFGEIASLSHAGAYKDQGHSIGPVIAGEYLFSPYGKVRYELGYQWGLTGATARGAVRWLFEYEIAF